MIVHYLNFVLIICLTLLLFEVKCDKRDACEDKHYWMSDDLRKLTLTTPENITELCTKFKCITTCCPSIKNKKQVHFASNIFPRQNCRFIDDIKKWTNNVVTEKTNFDYSELAIYKLNEHNDLEKTNLSFKDMKVRFNFKFFGDIKKCTTGLPSLGTSKSEEYFLLEGGTLVADLPNFYVRHPELSQNNFCVEYLVQHFSLNNSHSVNVSIHFLRHPALQRNNESAGVMFYTYYKVAAFIISSLFLLLVLVVYSSLPEMRSIGVMVQMAYCATYMVALILNAILILINQSLINSNGCRNLTIVKYYLLFASFFWMNIMSFDIWWSFRGWYKQRQIHRKGETVKFCWYSLYAWGTPLLITIAVAIIDSSDLSPNIIKPFFKYCFQASTEIKFYYNIPIGILLAANCVFFLLTAYNFWRIKQDLDKFTDSNSNDNRKVRFIMYFKLAVVMGIGWCFEVFDLPFWLEVIAATYNGFIGVTIAIIFVFKKKIFIKFCHRYGLQHRFVFVHNLERRWSTSTVQTRSLKKRSIVESESATETRSSSIAMSPSTTKDLSETKP